MIPYTHSENKDIPLLQFNNAHYCTNNLKSDLKTGGNMYFISLLKKTTLLTASAIIIIAMSCKNKSSEKDGWHDLFDGKTLNGWKVLNQDWTHPDSKPDFRVENNMIICNTTMNNEGGYLVTEKLYSNFILEFDVKIDSSLNSGLQCRSRVWDKDTTTTYVAGDVNGTQHVTKWPKGYVWDTQMKIV